MSSEIDYIFIKFYLLSCHNLFIIALVLSMFGIYNLLSCINYRGAGDEDKVTTEPVQQGTILPQKSELWYHKLILIYNVVMMCNFYYTITTSKALY